MSVFWWPTALWLVSGATTVTSPIPSSACLSASRPRDSTPSSLVTRICGRLVHSPSGRAWTRSARGPPRAAPPASGSPRSLSRSRRSVRARSRVMSGTSSAASRRVRARRRSCRDGGEAVGRVVVGARGRDGPAWPLAGSAPPEAPAEPPDAASADGSTAAAGAGSGRARRCRRRCRASARAGCGPACRRVPRAVARPARRPSGRPTCGAGTRATKADTTAAIGIPKIAPGMPAIRPPMRTEPRTTIGWMPTAPCMIRGWRTFITTNQPTPIRMIVGHDGVGLQDERDDDRRRPRHERPEERDHRRSPAATEVRAASGSPRSRFVPSATRK